MRVHLHFDKKNAAKVIGNAQMRVPNMFWLDMKILQKRRYKTSQLNVKKLQFLPPWLSKAEYTVIIGIEVDLVLF